MTIKSIERLRAALEAERAAAEEVVEFPVEKTDAVYREAKAKTDKLLAKVEKQLQNCADQTRGRIQRGEGGVPRPSQSFDGGVGPGGLGGAAVGGTISSLVINSPAAEPGSIARDALRRSQGWLRS